MIKNQTVWLFSIALMAFTGCVQAQEAKVGSIKIENAYVRATAPGQPAAGAFMKIENSGAADQLVSDLYLVFIAITLGAFMPNFKLVAFGSIGIFIAAAVLIQLKVFNYLTTEYLFAVLIVTLGFASIANLYRHYREFNL